MTEPMEAREIPIENSPYRIVDRDGNRYLQLKRYEGLTFSAMRLDEPDAVVLRNQQTMLQWLALMPEPEDVLLVGLGAGDMLRPLHRHLKQTRLVGVEVEPVIVDIARRYFNLAEDDERLSVVVGDGAAYVHEHPQSCDVLMIDVCDSELGYPETFSSKAFLAACHDAVRGNGPLLVNLFRRDEQWLDAYCQALSTYFPCIIMRRLEETHHVVTAFKKPPEFDWALLSERARQLEPTFRIGLPEYWAACEGSMAIVTSPPQR